MTNNSLLIIVKYKSLPWRICTACGGRSTNWLINAKSLKMNVTWNLTRQMCSQTERLRDELGIKPKEKSSLKAWNRTSYSSQWQISVHWGFVSGLLLDVSFKKAENQQGPYVILGGAEDYWCFLFLFIPDRRGRNNRILLSCMAFM